MPRSTSSRTSPIRSRPSSKESSASLSRPVTPNMPKAPHPTPVGSPALQPMQPIQVDHSRSLGQSIKDGFGFGIGNAIAHRIFGGSAKVEHVHTTQTTQTTQTTNIAQNQNPEYVQCLKESNQNIEACKHLLDQ